MARPFRTPPPLRVSLTGAGTVEAPGREALGAAGLGRLGRLAFAYLTVMRHRPVPRDELAEVLWGAQPPRTWETSLRVVASRIRSWLAPAGLDRSATLTAEFGCYRLHLPGGTHVDVEEAAADLAAARAAQAAGDAPEARLRAAAAAAAASHEFLPGAGGLWVERRQAEWAELRLSALEIVAWAALDSGDAAAALAAAEEAVALAPLRESAHVLALRASAAAGNRAEALRAYEELRRRLADELGVPPSPAAEAVYLALLRDGEAPGPGGPGSGPGPDDRPVPPHPLLGRHRLPAELSSFVGRGAELDDLVRRVRAARLVTLVGTGGLGKTRLALAAARRLDSEFADGVALLPLGSVADPDSVPALARSALGLAGDPHLSPADELAAWVADRHLLLMVDNCEHLVDAAARLVAGLLAAGPRLTVMATSREALGVPGEVAWQVPPLAPAEAAELFLARAAAAGSGARPTDMDAVESLCRRLDRIPLAIELAAARAAVLSPAEIAERLDDRFRLLTGGARTAPARQRTLRATIDWSYDALPGTERLLFDHLGVFAGSFTLSAAASVADLDSATALDAVTGLVARSLVTASTTGQGRYRMLETIRAYAAEKLAGAAGADAARQRFVAWAAGLAEQAESCLDGPEQSTWLDRLDAEHPNLLAALALPAPAPERLRLAAALGRFWEMRGHLHEGRERLRSVLAEATDAPALLRARAENAAGLLAQRQGDYAAARSRLEQSLALRRRYGDRLGVAVTLHGLANLAALSGDRPGARRLYAESLEEGRRLGDPALVAAALDNLGWVAHADGDFDAARARYEEALDLRSRAGDRHGTARLLGHLGDLAYQQGDYASAADLHARSLALRTELGDRAGRADSLATLGHLALDGDGGRGRARALLDESIALRRELGDRAGLPETLTARAEVAVLDGDLDGARALMEEAVELASAARNRPATAHVLVHRARLALAGGDRTGAARDYLRAAASGGLGSSDAVTAEWLEGAAAVVGDGDPALGARLLGAAGALRLDRRIPVPPHERPARARAAATVGVHLDPAGGVSTSAGAGLRPGEALDEAAQALTRLAGS